jgi:tetratricopeptide (TPR) repeat protein
LYSQAEQLYEQGDPYRAAPLFAEAEQQFRSVGDRRDELAAKFGRLRADADHGHYKSVKSEVERDFATPMVQSDPQLKIQALSLLGIIDLNIDTVAANSDWTQVLNVATASGDLRWQNRARGELGIVAGLKGDIGTAGAALFKAIPTAERMGDIGGAINFRVWLANGMTVNGMADGALKQLDKASELAEQHRYKHLPFQLLIARVRAIGALPEPERSKRTPEAKALLASTLQLAQDEKVYGAEVELLNQAGLLALQSGNAADAEQAFDRAAAVARGAELIGLEAEAELHLANLYVQLQEPQKAAASIERGIRDIRGQDEAYDFPLFVAAQADVEAAVGHVKAADALYERATTLLEGLLVNAPSSRVKSSMVSAFSRIYVAHFRLAWEQEHDSFKAFQIIESARGRALLDSIRYGTRSLSGSASPAEVRIAQLQRTLLESKLSTAQAKRILAQIDDSYDLLSASQPAQERREVAVLRHAPLSLPGLMRLLKPHQVFLEYVLDGKTSYALQVSRVGMQVHQLPGSAQISQLSNGYLRKINSGADARSEAQALYSAILAPIATSAGDSMIIVPDGTLHLIPFAALLDGSGRYLVQQTTIYIAPSAMFGRH